MTKQELIKYFELLPYVSITQLGKKSFIDLIEQLDEQEIVTIPKIVADWIEKCKAKEKSLLNALLYTPEGVNSWVDDPDNQETFALAWIFGFVGIAQLDILDQLLKNGFAMNTRCHSF